MFSKVRTKIMIISLLGIISIGVYYLQLIIFKDSHDTFFYFLQDLAFVPVQVIMVTLILNQVVNMVETRKKIKKVNVIICSFFIETGTPLLKLLSEFNRNKEEMSRIIKFENFDKNKEIEIKRQLSEFEYDIEINENKLNKLYQELKGQKSYMLQMLTNSSLLEHDSFTDMLWAVFHIIDELQSRENELEHMTKEDMQHLSVDILRGYSAMIIEWIQYMRYLNEEYPYLFKTEVEKISRWF